MLFLLSHSNENAAQSLVATPFLSRSHGSLNAFVPSLVAHISFLFLGGLLCLLSSLAWPGFFFELPSFSLLKASHIFFLMGV